MLFPVFEYNSDDGGATWRLTEDSATTLTYEELHNVFSILDAERMFWRAKFDLYYTEDSGKSWSVNHMFPVMTYLRMFTADLGVGLYVVKNQDKKYDIQLRGTEDNGAYWFTELGVVYSHSLQPRDAVFMSDSEVIVMHSGNFENELMRTTDRGVTWRSVLKIPLSDSVAFSKLMQVPGSDVLVLESYWNESLRISFDRGATWAPVAASTLGFTYRTRARLNSKGLRLWSAAGSEFGDVSENLLNPHWEEAFATYLLSSNDTGRTWQKIHLPTSLDGARIFDVLPAGDRINVITWKDSTTYISSAVIGQSGSVRTSQPISPKVFPNPVQYGEHIRFELPSDLIIDYSIIDPLGREVQQGSLDNQKILSTKGLAPGAYQIRLTSSGEAIGLTRIVVN